jgi:hypothetical protein
MHANAVLQFLSSAVKGNYTNQFETKYLQLKAKQYAPACWVYKRVSYIH